MARRSSPNGAHLPGDCRPISQILARVGDKWSILVMSMLGAKRMRFKELHRAIGGISQRMLTVTLRNLERDGFVIRTVYPTIPPRVEYELSDSGRALKDVVQPVAAWAIANRDRIEEARRRFDSAAGEALTAK